MSQSTNKRRLLTMGREGHLLGSTCLRLGKCSWTQNWTQNLDMDSLCFQVAARAATLSQCGTKLSLLRKPCSCTCTDLLDKLLCIGRIRIVRLCIDLLGIGKGRSLDTRNIQCTMFHIVEFERLKLQVYRCHLHISLRCSRLKTGFDNMESLNL
jgi:hypothetical protein